jgi:hypothetical protein
MDAGAVQRRGLVRDFVALIDFQKRMNGFMRGLKFLPSDEDLSLGTPVNPRLPPETFPQGLMP